VPIIMDKRIPVRLTDSSILDTEFSSIRERFDAEMRRMEDEMNNFRTQLLQRQDSFFNQGSLTSKSFLDSVTSELSDLNAAATATKTSSFSSTSSSQSSNQLGVVQPFGGGGALEGLSSPLIQDDGADGKSLKLRFDVSQYAPEEIVLKTVDNKLLVHAKHEEKTETKSVYREYNREFLLPTGVNPELIRSSLSKDGVLTVEAPLPQAALPAPK